MSDQKIDQCIFFLNVAISSLLSFPTNLLIFLNICFIIYNNFEKTLKKSKKAACRDDFN